MKRLFFLLVILATLPKFQAFAQYPMHLHTDHTVPSCQHHKQVLQEALLSRATTLDERSDTVDILKYHIDLDISDFEDKRIKGNCTIDLLCLQDGVNDLSFDLRALEVDSIKVNGNLQPFKYEEELISMSLPTVLAKGDTTSVCIYYQGSPSTATFGGFYFTSNYAYNLGVGIGIDPPNFGRAWFPCHDNFTDRAHYQFSITTQAQHSAVCNGLLTNQETLADGRIRWDWELAQEIPTYLASVAVADYEWLESNHTGLEREIPILYAAREADTARLKGSFEHMPECIDGFENAFGPYQFDRIGFVAVPFRGGAMEHAANIAYPTFALDGTYEWESLMAHEFAHHWWGDLVTCASADEMWLNEGWASFCANYFFEVAYGKERYKRETRQNHQEVLQYSHVRDGGFLAVSPIPFDYTYGSTVYDKGAVVAQALRGYMGDEAFFRCTRQFVQENAFTEITSLQFQDYLSDCSNTDLSHFFNNWVFKPGFPHFAIDSFDVRSVNDSSYIASLFIRQRLYEAPEFYTQVPIEVQFFDFFMQRHTTTIMVDGACNEIEVEIPIYPVYAALDMEEKIPDATVDEYVMVKEAGTYIFSNSYMDIDVIDVSDSSLIRVIHNMVMPDRFETEEEGVILSPNRYWTVEGMQKGTFNATGILYYNGSRSSSGGYLDNDLIGTSENSLEVYYRSSSASDWQELSTEIETGTSTSNKVGQIKVPRLNFGEYVLAYKTTSRTDTLKTYQPTNCTQQLITSVELNAPVVTDDLVFDILPNPTNGLTRIQFEQVPPNSRLLIYDAQGKLVKTIELLPTQPQFKIDTQDWTPGVYFLRAYVANEARGFKKMVVAK